MKHRHQNGFAGYLVTLAAGILIGILGYRMWTSTPTHYIYTNGSDTPLVLENFTISHTAADFYDAIISETREKASLVVFEQDLSVDTTVTKFGLGNWDIFTKYQNITYYGTGVYTVDLSQIKQITVDDTQKIVEVTIPHTTLDYVTINFEKTLFGDTEHGLLSFGDIKLTPEDQTILLKEMEDTMRVSLSTEEQFTQVDAVAVIKVKDLLNSAITSVSPTYHVEVIFE